MLKFPWPYARINFLIHPLLLRVFFKPWTSTPPWPPSLFEVARCAVVIHKNTLVCVQQPYVILLSIIWARQKVNSGFDISLSVLSLENIQHRIYFYPSCTALIKTVSIMKNHFVLVQCEVNDMYSFISSLRV